MKTLNVSFDGVLAALRSQPPRARGAGRALMFIAGRRGEGVTAAARIAAEAAGPGSVYALDLDPYRNALARRFAERGSLGPKLDGRFGGASFYTLVDRQGRLLPEREPLFGFHRVGGGALFVGAMDMRLAPPLARIAVADTPDYWNASRLYGDTVIVDAPALDHSRVGLRIARHMDGVVLVVGDGAGAAPAAIDAKNAIIAAGGNLIGLIYANASAPVMAMERVLRQAS